MIKTWSRSCWRSGGVAALVWSSQSGRAQQTRPNRVIGVRTREETHLLEPDGRRWVRGDYDGSNGSTGVAKRADCWILMLLKQLTRRVGVVRA